MFTFVLITFNHEAYILEHLESIRYQILQYGDGIEVSLIVSDDGSTDRTLFRLEKWLACYGVLFSQIQIFRSCKNLGIVSNYNRGVQSVRTETFKALAGDDLYYRNNVFHILRDRELVFSPVLHFQDEIIEPRDWGWMVLAKYGDQPQKLRKWLNFLNFIPAPGTFIKRSIAQDPGLIQFVSQYQWVEDFAKWHYLFCETTLNHVAYEKRPMVLYRSNSGVSTNLNHQKHSPYKMEERLLMKQWRIKVHRFPKWVNPYRYRMLFFRWKLLHIDKYLQPGIKERLECYRNEVCKAQVYLDEIRLQAKRFENTQLEDDGYGAVDTLGKARIEGDGLSVSL